VQYSPSRQAGMQRPAWPGKRLRSSAARLYCASRCAPGKGDVCCVPTSSRSVLPAWGLRTRMLLVLSAQLKCSSSDGHTLGLGCPRMRKILPGVHALVASVRARRQRRGMAAGRRRPAPRGFRVAYVLDFFRMLLDSQDGIRNKSETANEEMQMEGEDA